MDNAARRVLCATCKREIDIYDAISYNTGRSIKYLCKTCERRGMQDAIGHEVDTAHKKKKLWE